MGALKPGYFLLCSILGPADLFSRVRKLLTWATFWISDFEEGGAAELGGGADIHGLQRVIHALKAAVRAYKLRWITRSEAFQVDSLFMLVNTSEIVGGAVTTYRKAILGPWHPSSGKYECTRRSREHVPQALEAVGQADGIARKTARSVLLDLLCHLQCHDVSGGSEACHSAPSQ